MAIWLIRAGSYGEHEQKLIKESRGYVAKDGLELGFAECLRRRRPSFPPTPGTHGRIAPFNALQASSSAQSRSVVAKPLGGQCP